MKQVRESMQGVAKLCEQRLRSRPTPCRPLPKLTNRYCESLVFCAKNPLPLPSAVCLGLLIIQASPGGALRPWLVPAGWGALAGGLLARFGEKTAWDLVTSIGLTHSQLRVGGISSASPQLGAAKRGQEAGVTPGRSTPIRLPPGPTGAPWRAKRKAVNERQSQAQRNREAICD